jgi:ankyrin repeat protein
MANFFYYDANGQKQGAFTPQEIKALVAQGVINPQTPMESDAGQKGRAGQIPGLFPAPVQPTAQPVSQPQPIPQNIAVPIAEKNKSSLLVSVIGIVAILIVGGIGWVIMSGSGGSFTAAEKAEIDKFLVKNGNDVKAVDAESGYTMLHTAANGYDIAIVKYLISKGADVNAKNNYGQTPLHLAAGSGHDWGVKVVKYLVSKGADVHAQDNSANTPLDQAKEWNTNPAIIEYLTSQMKQVPPRPRQFTATEQAEIDNFCVEHGKDVKAVDEDGGTLLHVAMWNGSSIAVVQFLISNGADVNAKENRFDKTPLHYAVGKSAPNVGVVELLLASGADVNAKDKYDDKTPLHYAVGVLRPDAKNVEIVKLLISNGADVNAKNNKGNTPLATARLLNHTAIAEYLASVGGR